MWWPLTSRRTGGEESVRSAREGRARLLETGWYPETREIRWVRKALAVLVALCAALAAFIWWRLLAGLP
jgi:hypothetical protein